jgi:hypothetical protein
MSKDLPRLPNPIAESELYEKVLPWTATASQSSKRELFDALNRVADQQSALMKRWVEEECMLERMVWSKCVSNKWFAFQCHSESEEHDVCVKDRTLHMVNKRNRWINSHMERLLAPSPSPPPTKSD